MWIPVEGVRLGGATGLFLIYYLLVVVVEEALEFEASSLPVGMGLNHLVHDPSYPGIDEAEQTVEIIIILYLNTHFALPCGAELRCWKGESKGRATRLISFILINTNSYHLKLQVR